MLEWLHGVWAATAHFFQSIDWSMWGVWSLTTVLMIVGLLGAVLPFLPGPLLIFAAAVVHTLLRPESGVSWWGIGILGVMLVVSYTLDFLSGAIGARWFGASRWGMFGVLVGGVVGLFFNLPGLIFGPIIGGFVFEMIFAKKQVRPAVRSTWGTILGTGAGMIIRIIVSVAMVIVFLIDALWW